MNNFPSKWSMQCTEAVKSPQGNPNPGSSETPNKHTHPLNLFGGHSYSSDAFPSFSIQLGQEYSTQKGLSNKTSNVF